MKKLSIRAISLVLCVAMLVGYIVLPDMPAAQAETEVTTTVGPNLIANGTFGGQSASVITYPQQAMPAGWAVGGNKETDTEYLQVTNEYAYDGQYAMKLVDSLDSKAISAFQNITSITPDDAGTGFTASFYGKGSGTVTLALECYSSDTSFTTSGASKTLIKTISKVLTMTDAWTQYTLTNTIPDGTETVRFKITTKKADIVEVYLDNAWFSLDGVNTNMLTNESFETLPDATPEVSGPVGGADATGWGGLDTSTIFSIVADDRDASNMVLKMVDESTAAGGYVYYKVQATAGTYALKMDYNTASAPQIIVRAGDFSSAGTELFKQTMSGTSGAWKIFEANVEVPQDADIYILINSGVSSINTACFDNISLQKVTTTTGGNEGGNEGGNQGSTTPVTGNMIANGTFEKNGEINMDGWNNLPTAKSWSVVADPDKAGNFILQLADVYTNAGGYVYYTLEPATGTYKLKFDYKTEDAPQVIVRANAASTAGDELAKITLPSTNGEWKTYETTINVPVFAENLNILLNSANAPLNAGYFDNVSFEKVEGGNQGGGEDIQPGEEIVIPEQNLLGNPFFELTLYSYCTPLDATNAPSGWMVETIGKGAQLFKSNVMPAYNGEWSVRLVDNSATDSVKLYTKVENIQAGVEYAYIYTRTGTGSPMMAVRYYDANDNLLQEYSNAQAGYDNWRQSKKLALAPEGTSYAIVSLESNAAKKCDMYLDSVSFFATSDEKETNLLPNRSFEEYPEGFEDVLVSAKNEATTKGWTMNAGADKMSLVATETELDKSSVGNYMIKMVDELATGGANMFYTLDIEAGKTYSYSAMVRGDYSSGSPSIRIAFYYDEDCKQAAYIGKTQYKSQSISCSNEFWTRGTVSATAPEGAVKARLYLISANAAVGTAYFGNLALVEGVPTKFANLDFEDLDESGAMLKWNSYEDAKIAPYTKDSFAGKMSLQIKDNSEAAQQGTISLMTDLTGYQKSGLSVAQLMYYLTARIKDAKNVKAQLSIVYYDNGFKEVHRDSVTSAGTGKWQFLRLDSQHAANAAYARILVTVGENASAKGTIYVDDITIGGEYADLREEAYDWQIKEKEGNRLYFTDEELAAIREFAKDDTLNAFGASGANAYRGLIKEADGYMIATHYYASWDASPDGDRVTLYKVNLDHIQDYSTDPLLADVPGGRNWPYGEGISNGIYTRLSTVAMAYALTGDAKYAQKAIGWAMDICGWEYWCDTKYCWASNYNGTLGAPRIMRSVAVVYDMCYDQLTEEQKDIMVQNIIHKGMIPLCQDLDIPSRTFHNKYMARCVGIITAGAAIINEENKEEVGRYMDKAYAFCTAFIDNRYETDDNEGYSYTRMSTDDMLIAMDCARRATGRSGLLEHPYFTEVLIDWVCDFVAPITHEWPVFGDSYASGFFKPTMLILNRTFGIGEAGYFLQTVGMGNDNFNTLIYGAYDPVITAPDENDYVVYAERVGYGGLRTGWEDDDLVFYIIGNNSKLGHGHYDQLSFMMTTDGLWPALDPGYSNSNVGCFDEQQGHNIMLVDGQWQTLRGEGKLSPLVDGQLYGQFEGSAPGAYLGADENGKYTVPLLTQWDRNAIMINHGDRPYYIVIDEIADDNEHVYDFNLNTGGWTDITVDGKPMTEGVNKGNKVAVYGNQGYLFVEYVSKEKMNIEAVTYEDGGPVLQADSGSKKSAQYMTILTKPYGIEMDEKYSFLPLLNTPELVSYKTSSYDATIIKSVNGGGTPLFFFRGEKAGDWIELPFTVETAGNYELILKTCKSYNYGTYKIYIDGEEVATYDGYDIKVYALDLSLGKRDIEAGDHVLRLELVGVNPKSIGALISVASITFATERAMPDAPIYTQEVYDTDKVLGAKIYHTENNYDIVLHNRTTGKITAGGVTTNGQQAVIIGQMADGYLEGFTVVSGTTLTFNGKTLVKASSAATVSADFRGKAQYAVTTEKDQSISLYVPYEVVGATVDGKSVKYSVDGNIAKVSVPAGTHTVALQVKEAVEYLWGHESGEGKALYNENGEMIYKYWKDIDGTEYLFEDGQVKINAYYDAKTKVLIREELLEDGSWQVTTYDLIGNIAKIEIQHTNGNVTLIKYQTDGSISTTVTDSKGDNLEMIMEYKDGSKTVAQYLDDKTVTTKYGANGNVLSVTTMYNNGRRVEENYDENGKLLSKITRSKGGNREEVVYNADGSVVTTIYTANKLSSIQTVNADGTSVLEEHLEDGSVRVTKYDKDGNVTEVTIDGKLVEEEKADNSWIIIVIVAVAVVAAAALVIVLVKIKKKNGAASAE